MPTRFAEGSAHVREEVLTAVLLPMAAMHPNPPYCIWAQRALGGLRRAA